jgi:hypothetical protein
MNVGIPLDRLNGSVSGSGKLTSAVGGLDLECDLDLSSAVLVNREITDIQGHMSRSASLEQLDITELRGRLAGGRVAGTVGVNYGATGSAYSVETTLSNVSLDGLLERDDQDEPGPQLGGFVDASLYMNGRLGKSDSLRGGGRVSIAEARMFETPVLVSVLNVLGLAPPDTEPRQSIAGEFHLLGDRIGLKDIVLRDNTVGLIGSGQLIREPLEMDMRLVAVRPNGWFRIPLVTELLEGAARELVELRVTGSLNDPKVSAHALPGVEEAVDLLFEDDRSVQGRSSSPRS